MLYGIYHHIGHADSASPDEAPGRLHLDEQPFRRVVAQKGVDLGQGVDGQRLVVEGEGLDGDAAGRQHLDVGAVDRAVGSAGAPHDVGAPEADVEATDRHAAVTARHAPLPRLTGRDAGVRGAYHRAAKGRVTSDKTGC